ncbi:terpene synthase-like [Ptiloglossa arizonensis]|uniref:terpene synthase-like n=1 Tax=Ptiloglossa arizonensis TaxID=3350558 RepID=UPI003F9F159D
MKRYENVLPFTVNQDEDQIILQPFNYLRQVRGRQGEEKLSEILNLWFKIPEDKLRAIKDIIHITHISSILFDDIQDNAFIRWGIPTAHHIYGVAATLNAVNHTSVIIIEKIIALNHSGSLQVYLEKLLELHRGQGMEIYWRDNNICPSESEFKQMTIQKTGGLFKLIIGLMQQFSECTEDFTFLVDTLAIYIQIRNDYFNLYCEENTSKKTYADDLTLGNFSFPLLHAIQSRPEDTQIMTNKGILLQRPTDYDMKRYCVELIEKFGSFAYTRTVLKELDTKLRDEIQRLGGNLLLEQHLDNLMDWKTQDD